MLNPDKLNKLFIMATGKTPAIEQTKQVIQTANKSKKTRSSMNLAKMRGLYSDPFEAWTKWFRSEQRNVSMDNANDLWSEAEASFPGSPEQARDWMRSETNSLVDHPDPTIKDINLKKYLSKSPDWLSKEMLPTLAQTSATVSDQNLMKSKLAYRKLFMDKLSKIDFSELDPEVPVEVHVEDALKLEALGLLDSAQVFNGRLSTNNSGTIQPAFALDQSIQGITPGPEFKAIQEIAEPILTKEIGMALNNTTGIIEMDNKASRAVTRRMLESGNMDLSEWQNAITMLGNQDDVVDSGIKGIVEQNPFMDVEDDISAAIDINNIKRGIG